MATFQNPRRAKKEREREFRTLKERRNRPIFRTLKQIQVPQRLTLNAAEIRDLESLADPSSKTSN